MVPVVLKGQGVVTETSLWADQRFWILHFNDYQSLRLCSKILYAFIGFYIKFYLERLSTKLKLVLSSAEQPLNDLHLKDQGILKFCRS